MKRFLALFLAFIMLFSLVACGGGTEEEEQEPVDVVTTEIALIIEGDKVEADPYRNAIWEGIKIYGTINELTHKWYSVGSNELEATKTTIMTAIEEGAQIIIVGGSDFEEAVLSMAQEHTDINFVIIDGPGQTAEAESVMYENVAQVIFKEEEAGYLAGYAAVMEGYRSLGFIGGRDVPSVKRYGYGFVQGAEAAAQELQLESIDMKYHYLGHFDASPEVEAMAQSWYEEGVEVIFATAGAAGDSVMTAAEILGKKVIGVDIDQSMESGTVITSATKNLTEAVQTVLALYYHEHDQFPGNQILSMGILQRGVGLAMDTARMKNFTRDHYEVMIQEFLAAATTEGAEQIVILGDEVADVADIPVTIVTVNAE